MKRFEDLASPVVQTIETPLKNIEVAKMLDDVEAACGACRRAAFISIQERLHGRWICYRCGLVNAWKSK